MAIANLVDAGHWFVVRDGDPRALSLYLRHYSASKERPRRHGQATGAQARFMGPGEHLVLLSGDSQAVFGWRKQQYRRDGQRGVECVIFRNESQVLSSELVLEAERWAWQRWPGERLFTYVDPAEIGSPHPGYCFMQAGWHRALPLPRNGLVVREKFPADQVDPALYGQQLAVIEAARLLRDSWRAEDADWYMAAEWLQQDLVVLDAMERGEKPPTEFDPWGDDL